MATAPTLPLMTVDQYLELPDPPGPYVWELHFGELVKVGRPKKKHFNRQMRIRDLLTKALGTKRWIVEIELPYGLAPGYDSRAADVGAALRTRWEAEPEADYMIGSPDIVVQVTSRSNRDRKDEESALLHITHGATAVWLVKPDRREVVVVTGTSRTVYSDGESIPLPNAKSSRWLISSPSDPASFNYLSALSPRDR